MQSTVDIRVRLPEELRVRGVPEVTLTRVPILTRWTQLLNRLLINSPSVDLRQYEIRTLRHRRDTLRTCVHTRVSSFCFLIMG